LATGCIELVETMNLVVRDIGRGTSDDVCQERNDAAEEFVEAPLLGAARPFVKQQLLALPRARVDLSRVRLFNVERLVPGGGRRVSRTLLARGR
jgi:hypothetical protein